MAKKCADSVIDAALDKVAEATSLIALAAEPADRAAAISGALATATMDSGDYTNADGDTNGRKVTVAAQSGISVTASGTATHAALIDGTELLYVTEITSQALTSGNTVSFPAFDIEISDPT
jgi:hypothetical protein